MAAAMRTFAALIASILLLASPAYAIVGGAAPSDDNIGRAVVTIVGSRGNFCTGSLIAPTLVLTVAHCVQPGAEYKILEYDAQQKPELRDVRTVVVHPGFNLETMLGHRATADVALLWRQNPAKGKTPSALGAPVIPIMPGAKFTIAG